MKTHPIITTAFVTAIALLAVHASSRAAEPIEGLISHWAFDEGQGYTASDSAGDYDGTVYGAQWTDGQIDGALFFDGQGDYVRVGDKDRLDFGASEDFTISTWFKTSALGARMLVNKREKGKTAGYDLYLYIGEICARISDGPPVVLAQSAGQSFSDNQWHHAVAVFDRSDVITVYVDANLVATSPPISDIGNVDNGYPFAIGARLSSDTAAYFKGPIDDVRVYGRTLSADEVQQLYQAARIPVVALEITGPDRVRENSSAQFTAIATFEDGSTKDVTTSATWSAEPNIATIDDSGLLATQRIETADQITVSAHYTRHGGTVDAQLVIGVTALADLQISGPQQVAENSYAQYQAAAYYQDGSNADVTASATWSVEPQDVASISGNGHLNTDRIEADTSLNVYADYTVAGSTLQAQAAVQLAQPIALEITGPDKIPGSFQEQYHAVVTYEDDLTATVTTSALWSVEPQTYATVDQNGLATTAEVNQPQDITISAQYTSAAVTVETQVLVQVVPPRILHVPSEYLTIQAAIEDAFDGDIVLVAPGTYTGDGNRDIYFLGKKITVRSESGPENTIIDCNGSYEDPHRGFNFHELMGVNPTLDGFTITNGYGRREGGAIYAHHTDFTVSNCIFAHNSGSSKSFGGAILCDYASPKITNCTFTDNFAGGTGGAILLHRCTAVIDNCVLAENSSGYYGGAIYSYDSSATITNSTISHNSADEEGGGIHYYSGNNEDSLTITNCIITGNSVKSQYARGGGIYFYLRDAWYDPLIITNSVIAGNSAGGQGGGIFCNAPAAITHTTIVNNTANYDGGGIYAYRNAQIDITNSILWANSPEQINRYGDSELTITYSDVQGGWEGQGNVDADPCFVQPGSTCLEIQGDYHLLPTSPCIDAAKDVGIYTDIEGNVRPYDYPDIDNNGDFDMGAYEAFILPPYDRAVDRVTSVLTRQAELFALIDEFLALQWEAYDALDELLDTGDYSDAPKADITSAKQKIYSAMQHHEQSADAFEKAVEKLNDSLTSLGIEPEPNETTRKGLTE